MQVSLKKREETLKFSLAKKKVNIGSTIFRVAAALDISGSMQPLYSRGDVSEFVGKLLPFGLAMDDNGEIDMWAFNSEVQEIPSATADNYDDYVGKEMRDVSISGGTAYAPVMLDILNTYFGSTTIHRSVSKPSKSFFGKLFGKTESHTITETVSNDSQVPAIVFFTTDGECGDFSQARKVLKQSEGYPIYWVCVGIGNGFGSLKSFEKEFDNVSLITVDSLSLSDEDLYDKILSDGLNDFINNKGAK